MSEAENLPILFQSTTQKKKCQTNGTTEWQTNQRWGEGKKHFKILILNNKTWRLLFPKQQ